jgi:hypothetical protein
MSTMSFSRPNSPMREDANQDEECPEETASAKRNSACANDSDDSSYEETHRESSPPKKVKMDQNNEPPIKPLSVRCDTLQLGYDEVLCISAFHSFLIH